MRRFFAAGAVVTAVAAIGAAAAGACAPPPALGGCGKGFTLIYDTTQEGVLADRTQGNVNGDGYVCRQSHASPGGDIIIVDNVVPEQSNNV